LACAGRCRAGAASAASGRDKLAVYAIDPRQGILALALLQATPIKDVEVHLSGRYDHYDTYGNSFTPSASFKWTPSKMFGLRGSFARGFRAPNPAEAYNAGFSMEGPRSCGL
jgi:iron complex outermembrane receptor protein